MADSRAGSGNVQTEPGRSSSAKKRHAQKKKKKKKMTSACKKDPGAKSMELPMAKSGTI